MQDLLKFMGTVIIIHNINIVNIYIYTYYKFFSDMLFQHQYTYDSAN